MLGVVDRGSVYTLLGACRRPPLWGTRCRHKVHSQLCLDSEWCVAPHGVVDTIKRVYEQDTHAVAELIAIAVWRAEEHRAMLQQRPLDVRLASAGFRTRLGESRADAAGMVFPPPDVAARRSVVGTCSCD